MLGFARRLSKLPTARRAVRSAVRDAAPGTDRGSGDSARQRDGHMAWRARAGKRKGLGKEDGRLGRFQHGSHLILIPMPYVVYTCFWCGPDQAKIDHVRSPWPTSELP